MDRVRIFVVAGPNQGKTTIAHIVKDALENHNFKRVSLTDIKPSGEPKEPIEQRVRATQERPVSIEVVALRSSQKWLTALKNARTQIATLGSDTDEVNRAHLRELDEVIEELQIFAR